MLTLRMDFIKALPLALCLTLSSGGCSTFSQAKTCELIEKKFGADGFRVDVTEYISSNETTKTLFILPPTGGTNYIDRSYAKQFCKAGYDVYILNSWTGDTGTSTDLEIHQGFYTRMLKAVDLLDAEIKTPFLGMLGTSLGGLYAAVAASKIERIDAVFAIVAGAPITKVIVTSDQKEMRELAGTRRKRFGLDTDEKYLAALQTAFFLEPMDQGKLFSKKEYGMAIADQDTTVPTASQNELRDFWKPKKEFHLPNAHFWGIVNTWLYHDEELVSFFDASAEKKIKSLKH